MSNDEKNGGAIPRLLDEIVTPFLSPYYQDEAVTIYHGDARQIVPTLGMFDLLLTDPPYGIGKINQGGGRPEWMKDTLSWDLSTVSDVYELTRKAQKSIIWGGNYYSFPPSRCWMVWIKRDAVPSMANCELAWTNFDANARYFDTTIAATNAERVKHPTQKPLRLMKWCIGLAGNVKTILDPFGGSGTTGLAAKDLGKQCVLIEREEKYCEIAAKRMAQEVLF